MIKKIDIKLIETEKPELLPNIEDFFESLGNKYPISTTGLEFIKEAIISKTKLNDNEANIILKMFFQEIRNSILKKEKVVIRPLGQFFISSPSVTNNSKKIFVKFKPNKTLMRRINDK